MKPKPYHIIAYLKARAIAKRIRRSIKAGASAYAKANASRV